MVTAWPLTSGCSKLRRTVKSCWLREAGICLPAPSTTRDTLSALFSSKAAEVMLSSKGMKRTLALAARDCAAGETSASMVYCSTSMRERRSCARAAEAPSARVRTRASLRLRNMSNMSFQYLLYGERRPLGRSGAAGQFLADLGQAGLHCGAGAVVGEQAQGLARESAAGHLTSHEFRHDGASGDEVHHGIERNVDEEFAGQPTSGGHLIERDHGSAEEGSFHGDGSTCGEGEIGMRHGVPAFSFNHPNRRAPQAPGKKRGPGGGRGREHHIDGLFPVNPLDRVEQRRQMTRGFSLAASRQHRN